MDTDGHLWAWVFALAVFQSRHLWASELLALITKTPCEHRGLCYYKGQHFLKSWSQSDICISLFEMCYHGNVKCAHPSTARWLGSYQRFIHFCRKNNTHVHFLAVLVMHGYLTAINIWISRVIVAQTVTRRDDTDVSATLCSCLLSWEEKKHQYK